VEDPFHPGEDLLVLHLAGCGVATSGKNRRNWTRNGMFRHHIIDPRTGFPAQSDVLTATVVAPTLLEAEAAAKTLLILGSQAGLAWLEAHPLLAGLLIQEDGQAVCNPQLQEYL
jgi:thiamine biosynthesis lipoprotein